jgi:hypothetical protein
MTYSSAGSCQITATAAANATYAQATSSVTFLVTQMVPTLPDLSATMPLSGTGPSKIVQIQVDHPEGVARIGVVNMLVNHALDGADACYIAYSNPHNVLFLVDDSGPANGLSPALVLGGTGSVSNSQCTIFAAGSSAVVSGNRLTLTLDVAFRSSFTGSKVIYAAVRDLQERTSGWRAVGFQEVSPPATFPRSSSVTPSAGTTATASVSIALEDRSSISNLQTSWFLINTSIDARQGCFVGFYAPGNLLFLVGDDGDANTAAFVALGGSGVLENSQCRLSASGSSATRSGERLTLSLNLLFKPRFAGLKIIWTALSTLSGQRSQWKASGVWRVPAIEPEKWTAN